MIQFGTDGWRAIIGDQFTFENVERVAQAYADILTSQPAPLRTSIPLGFDRRFLSEEFAKTVASVLAANNLPVQISRQYCPTPCISWMAKTTGAPGGVVITASHNPYQWNGIKFKEGYGGSASPALTQAVEERIRANEKGGRKALKMDYDRALVEGRITTFDPQEAYVGELRSFVDVRRIEERLWKIAYDPLFGAGSGYLARVLELPLTEIHAEANPNFGGLNPEPIEKNLSALMDLVRREHYDVGLATDGDADRIGAVDEDGNFVNPHQIFALILDHLIEKGHRGDIVKTVSTTQMIDRIASLHGLKVHETPIGFKHICTKFLEITPLMGGEESGGIGIPSHVYERDGLLSGLLLLEIMTVKKKRLGEILNDLEQKIGPYHFVREDLHLSPEQLEIARSKITEKSLTHLGPHKVVTTNRLDGLKYILEDGSWLLLRPSGTEPIVRLYAEASRPEQVQELIREAYRILS